MNFLTKMMTLEYAALAVQTTTIAAERDAVTEQYHAARALNDLTHLNYLHDRSIFARDARASANAKVQAFSMQLEVLNRRVLASQRTLEKFLNS